MKGAAIKTTKQHVIEGFPERQGQSPFSSSLSDLNVKSLISLEFLFLAKNKAQ